MVYLRASAETLVARIGDDGGRPLLAGLGPTERLERVKALLAERGPCYETAALAVDADDGAPHEVAHAIAQQLEAGP